MNKYRVSIIVPVYNVEPYIDECLQSIANQTTSLIHCSSFKGDAGIECIIVDDRGTDHSIKNAKKFVTGYKGNIDFRIIQHEHNQGLSAARNTGIRAAKGEYVYFLDSDDSVTPDCLAGFLNIIQEHPYVDLIQGLIDQDSPYMNQFVSKEYPTYTEDRKYIKRAILDYDQLPVCAANKMVRRQLIIDQNLFFKEGIIHEDNYWSYFLAKHVKSLAVYPQKCYIYTVNPISITKDINISKEIHSSRILVEDFCNNIDVFLKGEQKATILYHLNIIFNNRYYENTEHKKELFNCLYHRCNLLEKCALRLWGKSKSNGRRKTKMFNLCIRLFKSLG